ncbi:MAG: Cas10/Cmr2 second palm domain-containing protein [Candidatus Methanomethylicaceae archaeon]
MSASSQLDVIRTSALLHDIGKLECWANRCAWSEHTHFTYKFVAKILGEDLALHARRHHMGPSYAAIDRPQNDIERTISLADHLASGADRREEPSPGPALPTPPVEMMHALSKNVVVSRLRAADLAYISQDVAQKLGDLRGRFAEDPRGCYFEIFDTLSRVGLDRVPADTRRPINDVSLWDHMKLTAAFATCLHLTGSKSFDPEDYEFALLSGDADRVSSFLNESMRLPDLNARSELIKKATETAADYIKCELGPECVVFASGGSVLALSPGNRSDSLLEGMKRRFEEVMSGLVTMTVTKVLERGDRISKDFGAVWSRARSSMRAEKGRRLLIPKASVQEGTEVCDVCRRLPSEKEDPLRILTLDASPRFERLCSSCWDLRNKGRGVWLEDLKDRKNLVGCIRADGDGIGRVLGGSFFAELGKASTPSRISTVSGFLKGLCEERFPKIIESFSRRSGTVFAGGDDLLAFVPGEVALRAARELAREFKEGTAGTCTLSAGVTIMDCSLPVYAGLESSSQLLRRAKEEGKGRVAYDFIRGVGEVGGGRVRTWEELDEILRLVEFMGRGGVTSSQLRMIVAASVRDLDFAEALIKHQMGRRIIGWKEGEQLLSGLRNQLLADAFLIYKTFKGG